MRSDVWNFLEIYSYAVRVAFLKCIVLFQLYVCMLGKLIACWGQVNTYSGGNSLVPTHPRKFDIKFN